MKPTSQAGQVVAVPPVSHGRVYLAIIAGAIGAAGLAAGRVWNCRVCGWDPDGSPWYQAVLIVVVPFLVSPVGILLFGLRAALQRTRGSLLDVLAVASGLVLPWIHFLFH
jgi:hypothetical protein